MSRKYIPGLLVEGRGLRGPKGDKGDAYNVSEITSYVTAYLSNYASLTHTHGSILGYNVTASSASNGLTLSVDSPGAAVNSVYGGSYVSMSTSGANSTVIVTGVQPAGAYLTTAAASNHTHGNVSTYSVAGSNVSYSSASNGLTLSVPNYLTTAANSYHSHNDLYVQLASSSNFAARTHDHSLNSIVTTTGDDLHISIASQGMTISQPNWITTAANSTHTHGNVYGINVTANSASNGLTLSVGNYLSNTYTSHTHSQYIGLNTAITGGSMTANTSGISINITGGGGTGGVAIGNTATVPFTSGSVQFSGANLTVNTSQGTGTQSTNQYIQLSVAAPEAAANSVIAGDYVSLSTNGASTTISVTGLQATSAMGNYIATSNSGNFVATANSSLFLPQASAASFFLDAYSSLLQAASNSNNSLGTTYTSHTHSQYLTTATASTHTHSDLAASTHTHGSVAITGGIGATSASSGLSLSIPAYLTTAANSTHIHGNVSLSMASLSGTYSSASNGLTLSLTNSTHSHPYVNTSASGNVYFVNSSGGNITWSTSASSNSTSVFATAGGGAGSGGVAIRGNATNVASTGTVIFSNANNISFGLTGNTMTATAEKGYIYFTNGSNATWGSSVSGASTSIMLTAGGGTGGGGGLAAIYDGTNAISGGSAYFSNSNGVSFGINGSTVTASYEKGSVHFVSNSGNVTWSSSVSGINTSIYATAPTGLRGIGNTASSNAFTSGSVMISGANLTVNTSSTGASQYLQISAPAIGYLYFSNANGHSWSSSTSGVSTSVWIVTA